MLTPCHNPQMIVYAMHGKVLRHNLLEDRTEEVLNAPFEAVSELFLIQCNIAVALAGEQVITTAASYS